MGVKWQVFIQLNSTKFISSFTNVSMFIVDTSKLKKIAFVTIPPYFIAVVNNSIFI